MIELIMVFKSIVGLSLSTTTNEASNQKSKTKRRPPSKIKRDKLRAKLHKKRFLDILKENNKRKNEEIEMKSSLQSCKGSEGFEKKHDKKREIWNKIKNSCKRKQDKRVSESQVMIEECSRSQDCVLNTLPVNENEINPHKVYGSIELRMKLCRLEEERNLIIALRHLVRLTHEGGKQIAFPTPEAVDRIQLRCSNLPTEPQDLMTLLTQVFERRNEKLNLHETYRDFVRSHGRVVLDHRQQWPNCHTLVRYSS